MQSLKSTVDFLVKYTLVINRNCQFALGFPGSFSASVLKETVFDIFNQVCNGSKMWKHTHTRDGLQIPNCGKDQTILCVWFLPGLICQPNVDSWWKWVLHSGPPRLSLLLSYGQLGECCWNLKNLWSSKPKEDYFSSRGSPMIDLSLIFM